MTTLGGLGHSLPYLIRDVKTATWIAVAVVLVELGVIAWIRHKLHGYALVIRGDPGGAGRVAGVRGGAADWEYPDLKSLAVWVMLRQEEPGAGETPALLSSQRNVPVWKLRAERWSRYSYWVLA